MIYRKEKGATLLEMMLVLAVMTTAGVYQFQQTMLEIEQKSARALGGEISSYAGGISRWLADNQSNLQTTIPIGNSKIYKGVGFLKHKSCGGSAIKAYVPCGFDDITSLGNIEYQAEISNSAGEMSAYSELGPLKVSGELRGDLSAISANTIRASYYDRSAFSVLHDPKGVDVSIATIGLNIIAGGETYLEVDGSNKMQNVFSFNPLMDKELQAIKNVNTIKGSADDVIVGNTGLKIENDMYVGGLAVINGGAINYGSEVIEGDLSLKGVLDVQKAANFKSNLNINNNLNVKNDAKIIGSVSVKGDTQIDGDANINGRVTVLNEAKGSHFSILDGHKEGDTCDTRSLTTDSEGYTMHCLSNVWVYIVSPIKEYWIGNWDPAGCWGTQVTNAKLTIEGKKWTLVATLLADYSYKKFTTVGTNGASMNYPHRRDNTQFAVMPDGTMKGRCKNWDTWKYAPIPGWD